MNRQLENIEDEALCEFCDTEKTKVKHKQVCPGCEDDFASMGIEIRDLKKQKDTFELQLAFTTAALERYLNGLTEGNITPKDLIDLMSKQIDNNTTVLKMNGK